MPLPSPILERVKPGVMWQPDKDAARWLLYEPGLDYHGVLTTDAPATGELAVNDLESDERAWANGQFHVDVYHAARAIRRHNDAREANLEINYLCEYACRHCFQTLRPARHSLATPTRAAVWQAADRLLAAASAEISITGGDIFLYPHLWDLLDYLHERAPDTTLRLLVNGGGLDPDDSSTRDRLAQRLGRRVIVKSDFFGHNAALHDAFTGIPGSFARLVRIVELCRELGIAIVSTAALTRMNFEYRFELVNFLFNLTDNSFTVATIIYPSDRRLDATLAELRLTSEQFAELMNESFFTPLAAEYLAFEEACSGDCQISVVSASGQAWGCSFLKIGTEPPNLTGNGHVPLPLLDMIDTWRGLAGEHTFFAECPTGSARPLCRRCPSFMMARPMGASYCHPSRVAFESVMGRVRQALAEGYRFVHPASMERVLVALDGCVVPEDVTP
ncbi:MAG: radical SAM protein [Planctomycetes bacterium]|nr:radical SAM protein [Planctomycetota bacterium]